MGEPRPSDIHVVAYRKNLPEGRQHPITLSVYTDNGEAVSAIPNPQAYADEGGPVWILSWGNPKDHKHTIAACIETLTYLLSPEYTAADAMKRLRELRLAYRRACEGEEFDGSHFNLPGGPPKPTTQPQEKPPA